MMASWSLNLQFCEMFGALRKRRCTGRGGRPSGGAGRDLASASAVGRAASQRRAEAMRRLYPKLSTWKADRSLLDRIGEVDRYLAQATGPGDLERRISEAESDAVEARPVS